MSKIDTCSVYHYDVRAMMSTIIVVASDARDRSAIVFLRHVPDPSPSSSSGHCIDQWCEADLQNQQSLEQVVDTMCRSVGVELDWRRCNRVRADQSVQSRAVELLREASLTRAMDCMAM